MKNPAASIKDRFQNHARAHRLPLNPLLERSGIKPKRIDFDAENTDKSGLKSFLPQATKLDIQERTNLVEV